MKTAVLAGLVGGIGHLTKASILPAILLAASILLVRGIVASFRKYGTDIQLIVDRHDDKPLWKYVRVVAILLLCFHIIIFPYLRTSKERFGKYYYNVNSRFYAWYDSWEQAEQGTKAHGDRQGWPEMAPEDIPSCKKYLSEHTFGEILNRFMSGFSDMKDRNAQSYGYAEFILVYVIAVCFLIWQNRYAWLSYLSRQGRPFVLFFVLGYFLGYLMLYTWYNPIAGGNRFILTFFLPFLFVVLRVLSFTQKNEMGFSIMGRKITASRISLIILLYLFAYAVLIFPTRISTMFGGS